MARNAQIVPKYKFPYVETVVNNYTIVDDDTVQVTNDPTSPSTAYMAVFTSDKGIDNKLVRIESLNDYYSVFGKPNFAKHGQPALMPAAILSNPNTSVWCMRVTPDDATYANATVYANVSVIEVEGRKKLKVYFTSDYTANASDMQTIIDTKEQAEVVFTNPIPLFTTFVNGRSAVGNKNRFRISINPAYEKEYKSKLYSFEVLDTSDGTTTVATYVGALTPSSKVKGKSAINDIIDDAEDTIPAIVHVYESNVEAIYDYYKEYVAEVNGLTESEIISIDEFDLLFAKKIATVSSRAGEDVTDIVIDPVTSHNTITVNSTQLTCPTYISNSEYEALPAGDKAGTSVTSGVVKTVTIVKTPVVPVENEQHHWVVSIAGREIDFGTTEPAADAKYVWAYDSFNSPEAAIILDDAVGNEYNGGDDGEFTEAAKEQKFVEAFSGSIDKSILTSKRSQVDAFFDANYPESVKLAMAKLAMYRFDAPVYIDRGISDDSLTPEEAETMVSALKPFYDIIDDNGFDPIVASLLNFNVGYYTIREPMNGRKVQVTDTYLFAQLYPEHIRNQGIETPFVGDRCILVDHVRNSHYPTLDTVDDDIKEILYEGRINYFESIAENDFRRAVQNTGAIEESDLQEENNIRVLLELKRSIELDAASQHYRFTSVTDRQNFKAFIEAKYRPWVGGRVLSLNVEYEMNEWEFERSIVHVYVAVTFRQLTKRTILEIDVNKRQFESEL